MSRLPGYWTEDAVPQPRQKPPEPAAQSRQDDSAVTDFCNERLKELSDLDKVEGLISSLNEEQQTVTAKINQAETQLNQLRQDILAASRASLSATSVFQSHYNDLNAQISNSWLSNYSHHESLTQLQGLDSKRRDLLRARSYLKILLNVYDLSAKVQAQITRDPQEATKTYMMLSELSKDLSERNEKAWGSAVHLTEFLQVTVKQLWEEMEKALSEDMKVALKKLNWPNEVKPSPTTAVDLNLLKAAFQRLSVFQDLPEFSSGPSTSSKTATVFSLLPFRIMAQDIDIRFRYHFESNRPTNNIEKPEWFFQSILSTIELHSDFMQNDLQTILNETGFKRIAITEFIAALHPILERKIDHILPELLGNGSLLSHFVHEALSFDRKVREEYLFVPYGRDTWEGITAYALEKPTAFNAWQKVEKDFAESRYSEILSAKDASEIEYEAVDAQDVKPTKGAMRIMDLIVSFTDRFRGLSSLEGRIQFVLEVQIAILNLYHSKWKSNLEKFELSHPFALAGELREDRKKQAGSVGLERICRVYGSAAWIEDHLKDWTDEVFLQIYAEIIESVRKKPIGHYSVIDLASQLSESISSSSDAGTVFDVTIAKFRSLREKSVRLIQSHLKREIFEEIRPYTNILHWSSLGMEDGEEFSVSTHQNSRELLTALPLIESMLKFLHKTLPQQTFLRIFKSFSNEIQAHLWEWMITAHRFSAAGGLLFARDMYAFWEVCSSVVPQPEQYMKRLHDAVVLLSLPSSVGSAVTVTGEMTLASVTKRLRDTDENDLPKITELKDWLADNLGVKTLSLAEVLYMYILNQTSI